MGPLLKLLILVALVGGGVLLWWQNQQPVSLTLFAFYRTPGLALGLWMLLFTLAGIITSILLRLLIYVPKPRVKAKVPPKQTMRSPVEEQPESVWADDNKQATSEPWDQLEVPKPEEVTTPPPPPSEPTQTGTTYSYSYVKATPKQKQNTTDQIYDAPYRVLNSPSPPPPADNEEDEDWV